MSSILENEIISKDFIELLEVDKELPPDSIILYLRNRGEQDSRITITPLAPVQYELTNQNPSIKLEGTSATFCLGSELV